MTNTQSDTTTATKQGNVEYVERARQLQPILAAAAPRIQEDRELPSDLVEALLYPIRQSHDDSMQRQ